MDRMDYQSLVVQDLVNLHSDKELDLNPWYQRRSVWSRSQKSYLINTLFEGKPVPAIYIRHSIDLDVGRSIKEVVDGQQRSRAIISYYKDDFAARHPEHDNRVKYSRLTPSQKQKFLLTALPVGYLLGATDSDVIDIFGRINSVSKTLNAQEKRNANYSGEFKQFCLTYASQKVDFWRQNSIFTANGIARMDEVQFISDVVNNMLHGLTDLKQPALNGVYKEFDEDFPEQAGIEERLDAIFQTVGWLPPNTIKETIFKRHPLFFSLVMALDESQIVDPERVKTAVREIDERFQSTENISDSDEEFKRACTSSTQTLSSRRIRHNYIISNL